jgi:hypothetical protein
LFAFVCYATKSILNMWKLLYAVEKFAAAVKLYFLHVFENFQTRVRFVCIFLHTISLVSIL